MSKRFVRRCRKWAAPPVCVSIGIAIGLAGDGIRAQQAAPSEHKGLEVETLGQVSADSMAEQIGVEGRILLLRAITVEPGGQIARHDHASVPGLVHMVSGEWVEGRPTGERTLSAGGDATLVEDVDTVHWFHNRGSEPATAIVCDIKPAG